MLHASSFRIPGKELRASLWLIFLLDECQSRRMRRKIERRSDSWYQFELHCLYCHHDNSRVCVWEEEGSISDIWGKKNINFSPTFMLILCRVILGAETSTSQQFTLSHSIKICWYMHVWPIQTNRDLDFLSFTFVGFWRCDFHIFLARNDN